MKKIKFVLCMIMIMVLGFSTVAYAEETPEVSFDGTSVLKFNRSTSNFGTNFKNMRPGESREQEMILDNDSNKTINYYMTAETIQAFEDFSKRSGAAYRVKLTIKQDGKKEVIYGGGEDGESSARIGGDDDGLSNMNGNISEWFLVATLDPWEEAELTMKVSLDGESHTNDYQDADGIFEYNFFVSYDDPSSKDNVIVVTEVKTVRSAQTGDDSDIALYAMMAGASLMILVALFIFWKKRDRAES